MKNAPGMHTQIDMELQLSNFRHCPIILKKVDIQPSTPLLPFFFYKSYLTKKKENKNKFAHITETVIFLKTFAKATCMEAKVAFQRYH